MKLKLNFCISIIILMALQCRAHKVDFQPELRDNSLWEWLLSIFRPLETLIPPTTTPATTLLKECTPCSCGTPNTITRIVGGEETQMLHYPWIALLKFYGEAFCGGVLISDLYVVTAAHCLRDFSASSMTIHFLIHHRSETTTTEIKRKVASLIEHEKYHPVFQYNDIGLIKLSEPLEFSDKLRPVCMPSPDKTYIGEMGIAIGWGAMWEGGPAAENLMQVSIPIIPNESCVKSYGADYITDNMLCAGYKEGGKDACQGDSGGPFHVYAEDLNIYNLVGVISWGVGCARPKYPGVYTHVSKYLDWLDKHTSESCKCQEPSKKLN